MLPLPFIIIKPLKNIRRINKSHQISIFFSFLTVGETGKEWRGASRELL